MADLVARVREAVSGEVRGAEPLSRHTTLGVGGPAAVFVAAESPADLTAVASICVEAGVPWLILGRGSNLLVADGGWPGVVVSLGSGFRGVTFDGEVAVAGGAEPMPALAHRVAEAGLGGLAFGVAIPGTLGGAVRMNAGAHGRELRDVLLWADVVLLADDAKIVRLGRDDLAMGYRHSAVPEDGVVIRAALDLERSDPAALAEAMAEMKRWRREHQPLGEPSCGSVFRNPPGDSAGRLIDASGLKGYRVGGARVSPVHANFITVERHRTRAADVQQVIHDVQAAVENAHGVRLVPEVVMVGFEEAIS